MYCMKCGRKLKDNQVFCPDCLAIMDDYPVKPGTPIQLPNRTNTPSSPTKSPKKKPRKPEEQILQLRSTVRWLTLSLIVALLAFIITAFMMFWLLDGPGWQPLI